MRYVLRFGKCYVLRSLGTAKRNTSAKQCLRFARPPFRPTFWVLCRRNNYYVLRYIVTFWVKFLRFGKCYVLRPYRARSMRAHSGADHRMLQRSVSCLLVAVYSQESLCNVSIAFLCVRVATCDLSSMLLQLNLIILTKLQII